MVIPGCIDTENIIYFKIDNKNDFFVVRWLQKPKKKILFQYLKDINGYTYKIGVSKKIVHQIQKLYTKYKYEYYDEEGCIIKISSKLSLSKHLIKIVVTKNEL